MGLDTVELVLAFEDAFDTEIPDADAEQMLTPAMVIDYIFAKQPEDAVEVDNLENRAVPAILKAIGKADLLPPFTVTPESKLNEVFPIKTRRDDWKQFERSYGKDLPILHRPAWMVSILQIMTVVISICGAILLAEFFFYRWGILFFAMIGLAIACGWFFARISRPWKRNFPEEIGPTIRDLAAELEQSYPSSTLSPNEKLSRRQIAETVKKIILEQTAIEESEYNPEAEFVRDMGLD